MSRAQEGPSARPGEAGVVASGRGRTGLGVRTLLPPETPLGPPHGSTVATRKEGRPPHPAAVLFLDKQLYFSRFRFSKSSVFRLL